MIRPFIGVAIAAALTTPALAEPLHFRDSSFSRPEGSVGVGVTIPFGGNRKKDPARVELRIARDMVNMDGSRQSATSLRTMETRIGFSLEHDRRLLVNGRPVDTKRRNNVSTVGWIAIGAGVALVIGGVLFADAVNDASD